MSLPIPTEQAIQRAILDYLELKKYFAVKFNNVGIRKLDGSFIPPRQRGIPDILACSPTGQFVAIEVKRPGLSANDEQDEIIERIRKTGGRAMVAHSVDEVVKAGL